MKTKTTSVLGIISVALLLLEVQPLSAQGGRKITKLADGVYAIEHGGQSGGNTTVIIGERQVFVVDSCFLPSAAQADIAQIRQWTDKPVAFVLNTHFHNDHNLGNHAYMAAFPAVTIIAHVETKKEMDRFGPGSALREEAGIVSLRKTKEIQAPTRNVPEFPTRYATGVKLSWRGLGAALRTKINFKIKTPTSAETRQKWGALFQRGAAQR